MMLGQQLILSRWNIKIIKKDYWSFKDYKIFIEKIHVPVKILVESSDMNWVNVKSVLAGVITSH